MNFPFRVMLPLPMMIKVDSVMERLRDLHAKKVEALDKRMRAGADPDKIARERAALRDQAKKLTAHHLVRALVMQGVSLLDRKPEDILPIMLSDTVRVGRPSGPRAA